MRDDEWITIVIPVFNLQNERQINFRKIIDFLERSKIHVIISEQILFDKEVSWISSYVKNIDNIDYYSYKIEDNIIHKSFLINRSVENTNSKYIWLLDADVYLHYKDILRYIDDQDVIKPFKSIIRLTPEETHSFLQKEIFHVRKGETKITTRIFGPLSIIIKKDVFNKIGGMNENYKGWGWEDLDFALRIQEVYDTIYEIPLNGLHLYHERDMSNEKENRKIFNEECFDKDGYGKVHLKNNEDFDVNQNGNLMIKQTQESSNAIPESIKNQSVYVDVYESDYDKKIDLTNVSVVIPTRIDTNDRLRNLRIVLNYFNDFFENFELIVIEQDINEKTRDIVEHFGFKYIFKHTTGSFHKTQNLNQAIAMTSNDFIAAYDTDVIYHPKALKIAFDRLKNRETNFIYPYNAFMVEIKKFLVEDIDKLDLNFIQSLPFTESGADFNNTEEFEVLYGDLSYECTGGSFFFNKFHFFLNGGYNPNIISYGCEDNEIELRIKKLGNKVERLKNYNCYHIEHDRASNSHYNNFFNSNEKEFVKIKNMNTDDLKEYVDNGFKHTHFDISKFLTITNDENEYAIKIFEEKNKIDLHDVDIIFPTFVDTQDRMRNLQTAMKYIEENFVNYNIILIEMESQKAKYLYHKINVKYYHFKEKFNKTKAINLGLEKCTNPIVSIWDVDVLIDSKGVADAVNKIRSGKYKISYPYNGWFVDIDGKKLQKLIKKLNIHELPFFNEENNASKDSELSIRKSTRNRFSGGGNNGGCVFFNRKTLSELGNYNENFYAWGYEDDEIEQRFKIMGHEKYNSPYANCWHMVHDRDSESSVQGKEFFNVNEKEFRKVLSMTKEQLNAYIKKDFFTTKNKLDIIVKDRVNEKIIHSYIQNPKVELIFVPDDCLIKHDKVICGHDKTAKSKVVLYDYGDGIITDHFINKVLNIFSETRRSLIIDDQNRIVGLLKYFTKIYNDIDRDSFMIFKSSDIQNKTKCSIIYTTYGDKAKKTEEYFEYVKQWKNEDYELIATVHDTSALHTALLEKYKAEGLIDKLIYTTSKHGHLRSVSLSVKHCQSDLIAIINNDIHVGSGVLDYCIERFENNDKLGIIGWHYNDNPTHDGTYWINDELIYTVRKDQSEYLLPSEIKAIQDAKWNTNRILDYFDHKPKRLLLSNGSFFVTRKDLWNKTGGMDPNIFDHYFSDDFYNYAVLDQGYNIENLPESIRCSQMKDIFNAKSDDVWNGDNQEEKQDQINDMKESLFETIVDLLSDVHENPKVALVGTNDLVLSKFEDVSNQSSVDEKYDLMVLEEPINDIRKAFHYLSDRGFILTSRKDYLPEEYQKNNSGNVVILHNRELYSYNKMDDNRMKKDVNNIKKNVVKYNPSLDKNKFVFLTQPRVGFTCLKIFFDKHPDVDLAANIFGSGDNQISRALSENRKEDPLKFLNSYFNLASIKTNKSAVGFRFNVWDEPIDIIEKSILHMDDLKIITLGRRNLLNSLIDCAFAHETEIWHSQMTITDLPEIEIDLEWAQGWLSNADVIFNEWKETLDEYNREYLKIDYEDIFGPEKQKYLNEIYNYLDVRIFRGYYPLVASPMDIMYNKVKNIEELLENFGEKYDRK